MSYLTAADVPEGFAKIFSIAPDVPEAGKFADYVLRNYNESNTFSPSLWASASTDFTTTYGVEIYHRKFDGEFYYHHPHSPTAVQQIFDAQTIISLKIRSVRAGENFHPRKAQRLLDASIQANIDLYQEGKIDVLQFLEAVRDVKYPKTHDPAEEVDDLEDPDSDPERP